MTSGRERRDVPPLRHPARRRTAWKFGCASFVPRNAGVVGAGSAGDARVDRQIDAGEGTAHDGKSRRFGVDLDLTSRLCAAPPPPPLVRAGCHAL